MFVVGCAINRSEYARYNLPLSRGFHPVYKYYDDKRKGSIRFNYKSTNLYHSPLVVRKDCACFANVLWALMYIHLIFHPQVLLTRAQLMSAYQDARNAWPRVSHACPPWQKVRKPHACLLQGGKSQIISTGILHYRAVTTAVRARQVRLQ